MKNKVLKLCKRLNKVTASEIAPILMITEAEAREILNELVNEGSLTIRGDLVYFYKEIQTKPTLPLFFEFREQKEIELLLKCFCAEVPTEKTIWITEIGINIVNKFNSYFRKLIYEKQLKELVKLFDNNPQMAKPYLLLMLFGVHSQDFPCLLLQYHLHPNIVLLRYVCDREFLPQFLFHMLFRVVKIFLKYCNQEF